MENSLKKRITERNVRKGVAIARKIRRERNEMTQIEQFNIKTYQKIHSPEYAIKREKSKRKDWCSRIEVNILKTGELDERDWRGRVNTERKILTTRKTNERDGRKDSENGTIKSYNAAKEEQVPILERCFHGINPRSSSCYIRDKK